LIINPRSDSEFVRLVEEMSASTAMPSELQGLVREQHPRAVVHSRELSGELQVVWYVYRDGKWVP